MGTTSRSSGGSTTYLLQSEELKMSLRRPTDARDVPLLLLPISTPFKNLNEAGDEGGRGIRNNRVEVPPLCKTGNVPYEESLNYSRMKVLHHGARQELGKENEGSHQSSPPPVLKEGGQPKQQPPLPISTNPPATTTKNPSTLPAGSLRHPQKCKLCGHYRAAYPASHLTKSASGGACIGTVPLRISVASSNNDSNSGDCSCEPCSTFLSCWIRGKFYYFYCCCRHRRCIMI